MRSPTTVRRARPDDLADLLAFTLEMVRESEGRTLDAAVVAGGLQQALADQTGRPYFVAERDEAPVGMCFMTTEWSDWTAAWYWWFQSVYILPDHRRTGVFDALYDHVANVALTEGVRLLRLYVHEDNARAMRTYARVGMRPAPYLIYESPL